MTPRSLIRSALRLLGPRRPPLHERSAHSLYSPGPGEDPSPLYAGLRREGPVHLMREGFWLVLGYDEVAYALRHPELFSSVHTPPRFDPILNESDPPHHTALRRRVAPCFAAARTEGLERTARACARELLEGAGGRLEMVGAFAVPLTETVAGAFLGLAPHDTAALRARLDGHRDARYGAGYTVLEEWLRSHAAQGAGAPCAPGSDEEAVGLLKLFWVAATSTTARLIPLAMLRLLRDPGLRSRLLHDRALIPAFVEEAARLHPPEQLLWRVARPGAELGGRAIPAGAGVRLCVGAANRDPAHFADPDTLSLERSPNPHLTFGLGPHFCPGARLARMQLRVAVETVLELWPGFALACAGDDPRMVHPVDHHGLVSLPVVRG
ncbi:MAG TPA: cytochrome P450 [Longimicrobium sp.]|jgi:hypothetical protein